MSDSVPVSSIYVHLNILRGSIFKGLDTIQASVVTHELQTHKDMPPVACNHGVNSYYDKYHIYTDIFSKMNFLLSFKNLWLLKTLFKSKSV